jgi:hypothetical protein
LGPAEFVLPEDRERIQSAKRYILNKNRTRDNAQKHNICINESSSQNLDFVPVFYLLILITTIFLRKMLSDVRTAVVYSLVGYNAV